MFGIVSTATNLRQRDNEVGPGAELLSYQGVEYIRAVLEDR